MWHTRKLVLFSTLLAVSTAQNGNSFHEDIPVEKFHSMWSGSRRWHGPEYWANPLQNWYLKDGWATAPAAYQRTLCLLPFEIEENGSYADMYVDVKINPFKAQTNELHKFGAGFRIGRKGRLKDHRNALIDPVKWLDAYLRADGALAIFDKASNDKFNVNRGTVSLKLKLEKYDEYAKIVLTGIQKSKFLSIERWFNLDEILGTFCLLSKGPGHPGKVSSALGNLKLEGNLLKSHWDRVFGPILWSQYSLNRGNLRILAQLILLDESVPVELWVENDNDDLEWKQEAWMDVLSRTAIFNLHGWNSNLGKKYEIRVNMFGMAYSWGGYIRADPKDKENLRIAAFSCDRGYTFPLTNMVEQVKEQNPDIMFFAGDQIYEIYGGFGDARTANTNYAMLDYQRKYYQFGWTWRDLLKDRPSVILPDDHDVFQGNLFGNGGTRLENKYPHKWPDGGYIMSGEWIRAVERMQTGHLPDPAIDQTLPIGIKPYFTKMVYGAVGFAILEDRKFKTAPNSLPENKRKRGDGAELFGKEQESFINAWAHDWTDQEMKVALSQTLLSKATTHETPELKRIYYDHDSGGWPGDARNRVVKIFGEHNVFSIHGDQHLGLLARLGVNNFNDAGYAFMVPGTANGWPRAWWPGLKNDERPDADRCFLGEYTDDSGHPLTVLAVANPEKGSFDLDPDSTNVEEIAYRKGSGYGIVDLNKKSKTATINLFRTGRKYEQFKTFPKTIYVGGRYDRWANRHHEPIHMDQTCPVRFKF